MIHIDSIDDFQKNILQWFVHKGRHGLPWKLRVDGSSPDSGESISPYGIWIAEVMLQQTQVKVVLPYWQKWIKAFPSLQDLVEADEQEVLMQWQGLGYYSRAKRIHQASKLLIRIVGKDRTSEPSYWPVELDQWMILPGIGRSTAGSIISSAFDLPAPILDGNVKRLLIRLFASNRPPNQDQKRLWELSKLLLSVDSPRNFNQALMDLGATVCTVKKPSCACCPLQNYCLAYINYDPRDFPRKDMKKIIPFQEIGIGLIFNKNGEILIDQRLDSSSMGGMWEFPGGKKEFNESIENTIEREIREEVGIQVKVGEKLLSFEHLYSHKKLHFIVHICEWKSGQPMPLASQKLLWVAPDRLLDFPFPAANSKIISELHKHLGI
tara:strand:- start:624 stop:1763 length:1140 start_codon:yes stop_codon:yes gene_type:complete